MWLSIDVLWDFYCSLISLTIYGGVTCVLLLVSKVLWNRYILASAVDPSSRLTLPIPPGDFGFPLVGETIPWAVQGSKFNLLRRRRYGNIFSTHALGQPMVKITGAHNVRQVLQEANDKMATIWPESMRRILGEKSFTNLSGDEHKYMRKIAVKAFTHSALNSYIPATRKIIASKICSWRDSSGVQNVYDEILQMTFEVSAKIMAGLTFESPDQMNEVFCTFHEMINNVISFPCDLPMSGFRKGLRSSKVMHDILKEHIQKKRARLQCNGNASSEVEEYNDVLQYMLEADLEERAKFVSSDSESEAELSLKNGLGEKSSPPLVDLEEPIMSLLSAGYLPTASGISCVMIQLAKHPDVREKLVQELEDHGVLNCDGKEKSVDIELHVIQKLQYMERVVKETLRLMPPILGGFRKALETFQIGEYRIPKGWTVVYNIQDTHAYEFRDHEDFDPDRFSREKIKADTSGRFRWLPFGGGPRVCVGKDFARLLIKLVVIELLRNFRSWTLASEKDLKMQTVPALHPANGLPIMFTPR